LPGRPAGADASAVARLGAAPSFPLAFAALLGPAEKKEIDEVADRLRLSNAERARVQWLAAHAGALAHPARLPAHVLKPLLAHPAARELIALGRASGDADAADYCEEKLREWPPEVLDPPHLVTGDDLK